MHDGTASEGEHLCPCLVVPDNMEFVFAVREVLTTGRQHLSFSIVDLKGQPLSHVIVNEFGPQCGVYLQMLDGALLAWVRTSVMHEWPSRLPEICRPSGEVFCTVAKEEPMGGGQCYNLRNRSGQRLLVFCGNFREKTVKVTNSSGQLVGTSERCMIDFDSMPHYQVRVAPQSDAGLVLCGLLAIEKVEGRHH